MSSRPPCGWRKVRSRARHAEIQRRRRRNARRVDDCTILLSCTIDDGAAPTPGRVPWDEARKKRHREYMVVWRQRHPEALNNWRRANRHKVAAERKRWKLRFPEKHRAVKRRSGKRRRSVLAFSYVKWLLINSGVAVPTEADIEGKRRQILAARNHSTFQLFATPSAVATLEKGTNGNN